jgi:4-aminobutyrate aminotransferase
LGVIAEEQRVARTAELGDYLVGQLRAMAADLPVVVEVRGGGLLVGVELVTEEGAPAVELADRVLYAARERGLSFKTTMGSVLTLSAPLTISRTEIDLAVAILVECLAEAGR